MKNRARREAQGRGQIEILPGVLKQFIKKHQRFKFLTEDYNFRNDADQQMPVYLPARKIQLAEMKDLRKLMEASEPKPRATMAQLSMHIDIIEKPEGRVINNLMGLETALRAFIKQKIIQGWVFAKRDGEDFLQPMLVTSIAYHPPRVIAKERYPAYVDLQGTWFSKGETTSERFNWGMEDLGHDVEKLLFGKGLFKESRKLIDEYLKHEGQFLKWRKSMGVQFIGTGTFTTPDEERSWHENERKMAGEKLVVDDRCDAIPQRKATDLFDGVVAGIDTDDEDDDPDLGEGDMEEMEKQAAQAGFTRVPMSFFIWCFNLESHDSGWIRMDMMKPYVYRPEVKSKLVLAPEFEDLIDALSADRNMLLEDIVHGKSGGTTIILQGKAGTGKTLTAEIYAEVMKVPLYRVHSGQLGIEASTVEEVLKEALKRTKRWNCAMLIDEADVFLRSRGDSLEQNAIVGVFLRVLEYFDGLLFLTTNRVDEIDEAILSRAIANIKFQPPEEDERARLWQTLGEVYKVKFLDDQKVCRQLARSMVCTGRDIKGLIRLAVKYSNQRKRKLSAEGIQRMAIFKGIVVKGAKT